MIKNCEVPSFEDRAATAFVGSLKKEDTDIATKERMTSSRLVEKTRDSFIRIIWEKGQQANRTFSLFEPAIRFPTLPAFYTLSS